MYRAVALASMRRPDRPTADVAAELDFELGDRVVAGGEDVTEAIRAHEVSEAASKIATDERVRQALVQKQRELLSSGDWVVEGRDIGTVVARDAELRSFFMGSAEARAFRSVGELGVDWRTVL